MVLKFKSCDISNSDMARRKYKELPLSENMKVLNLTKKKTSMLKLIRSTVRTKLLFLM